jgi:hypothetical protein
MNSVLTKAIIRVENAMNEALELLKVETNILHRLALVKEIELQANTLITLAKEHNRLIHKRR